MALAAKVILPGLPKKEMSIRTLRLHIHHEERYSAMWPIQRPKVERFSFNERGRRLIQFMVDAGQKRLFEVRQHIQSKHFIHRIVLVAVMREG